MFTNRPINWKWITGLTLGAALLLVVFRAPFALSALLPLVFVLACPVGMGLMMWLMMRGMGKMGATQDAVSPTTPVPTPPASSVPKAVALTRAERAAQLRTDLAALQKQQQDLEQAITGFADAPATDRATKNAVHP